MTVTPHSMNDEGTTKAQSATASTVAVAATGAIFSSTPAGSDSLVVKVHGDIDVRSAPILTDYVSARVSPGVRLIFDLSDVDFFGIAGLAVFTALDSASEAAGATWCLIEGHPVHRLLEAAAVVTTVQRFDSVEDALG
ncbi:MAG: STAS domain-containing protein [Rhodococcus sp. (in: high G+C Gram-positive bacteria)]